MKKHVLALAIILGLTITVAAQQVTGTGGSSSVRTVTSTYTSTIPFSRLLTNLGRTTATSNITFTKSTTGAQPGYGTIVQVIADGTHTVDYSAFRETTGSSGYVNTSGVVNVFVFLYDGTYYWVNIFQELNGTPLDIIAPVLSTATVEASFPNKIVLTYGENLNSGVVPATTDFSPSGGFTVTNVAIASAVVTLTVSGNYVGGDTITVSYTPGTNKLQDAAGNTCIALVTQSVTNNTVGGLPITGQAHWTNVGGNNWESDDQSLDVMKSTKKSTGDGWVQWDLKGGFGGASSVLVGFATTDVGTPYTAYSYGLSNFNGTYLSWEGAANATTSVAATVGDLLRLRRSGTSLLAEKSSNGGSSWATLKTWTGVTGDLYFGADDVVAPPSDEAKLYNLIYSVAGWANK